MTDEEIQKIVESNEFLKTKALRIAAILERTGINGGRVNFSYLKPRFPHTPYNTLVNLLPSLKRQGLLTREDGRLTKKGEELLSQIAETGSAEKTPPRQLAVEPVTRPAVQWESLYLMEGPPGRGMGLKYMESAFPKLPETERQFLQAYLAAVLRNPKTYDAKSRTYKPGNFDFKKCFVITDTVNRFLDEGQVPEEFYRTLDLFSPEDDRIFTLFGEALLKTAEDRRAFFQDVAQQRDAESAYQVAREKYHISVSYKGMESHV